MALKFTKPKPPVKIPCALRVGAVCGFPVLGSGSDTNRLKMLKRAVGYDPNNRSAHYLLAQVLQQMGKVEEAKREFAIAERLQGDSK
jgi:Tfp pilus assembly protein PilF